MSKFSLQRPLCKLTPVQTADASKNVAPCNPPDTFGDAVQSLLARFDDVLVKLDRIEAKIDLLPFVSMNVAADLDAAAIPH